MALTSSSWDAFREAAAEIAGEAEKAGLVEQLKTGLVDQLLGVAKDKLDARFPQEKRIIENMIDASLALSELSTAKRHARLANLASFFSEAALRSELKNVGCQLLSFSKQDAEKGGPPQWYTCSCANGEFVVAFRGTGSLTDALTDINVVPARVRGPGSLRVHKGFLDAIHLSWQNGLKGELIPSKVAAATSVTIVGHSLGGALAQTLVASDLLPPANLGKYKVVSFGGPTVFYSSQPLANDIRHAEVTQWVLDDDPVPRLLGSDFSKLVWAKPLQMVLEAGAENIAEKLGIEREKVDFLSAVMKVGGEVGQHTRRYVFLNHAKVYWLQDKNIYSVPQGQRQALLTYQGVKSIPLKGLISHPAASYVRALGQIISSSNNKIDL
jgi:hypothetical protein